MGRVTFSLIWDEHTGKGIDLKVHETYKETYELLVIGNQKLVSLIMAKTGLNPSAKSIYLDHLTDETGRFMSIGNQT